ncbi:hypothetical protein EDB81DRAFT_362431 [Dactylonectria macrodidyma]|uniref:F-box domain-containing protein n=1 Tax=Dactylonectria macrodidyma TaxID=307937 RepID=A0A9P9D2X7_9HYPO|nr:hypothetical protein EDB81DRAFT_362431 [Dactylonectria macrodidyma]
MHTFKSLPREILFMISDLLDRHSYKSLAQTQHFWRGVLWDGYQLFVATRARSTDTLESFRSMLSFLKGKPGKYIGLCLLAHSTQVRNIGLRGANDDENIQGASDDDNTKKMREVQKDAERELLSVTRYLLEGLKGLANQQTECLKFLISTFEDENFYLENIPDRAYLGGIVTVPEAERIFKIWDGEERHMFRWYIAPFCKTYAHKAFQVAKQAQLLEKIETVPRFATLAHELLGEGPNDKWWTKPNINKHIHSSRKRGRQPSEQDTKIGQDQLWGAIAATNILHGIHEYLGEEVDSDEDSEDRPEDELVGLQPLQRYICLIYE